MSRGKQNLIIRDRCVAILRQNPDGLSADQIKDKLSEITTRFPSANAISNILSTTPGIGKNGEVSVRGLTGSNRSPLWVVINLEEWRRWRAKYE